MVDQATGVGQRQGFPGQPVPPLAAKQSEDDRVLGFAFLKVALPQEPLAPKAEACQDP